MTPPKVDEAMLREVLSMCGKAIESNAEIMKMFSTFAAQNADTIRLVRDQNEILRKSNERMETFMFVGDPAKNVPSFVSETREGIADASGTIKRWSESASRVMWIIVTVVVTTGVGAFIVWRFPTPAW